MSQHPWASDTEVTEALVIQCIERQFKGLCVSKLSFMGQGWDNKVFLVNDQIVFRFPHRKIAAQLIPRENAVLNYLYSQVELEIPKPIYEGLPDEHYPYPFQGYRLIKGTPGYRVDDLRVRKEAIVPLAHFLRKLHSVPMEDILDLGVSQPIFDRTQVDLMAQQLFERLEQISHNSIAHIHLENIQWEIKQAQRIQLPKNQKVLIHGDLYGRHLLFNEEKLTGIIDWGDVAINSPSVDLAVVFSFFPKDYHSQFWEIYGKVGENVWAYARFLGIYSLLTILLYAHDMRNDALKKDAVYSLNRLDPKLVEI